MKKSIISAIAALAFAGAVQAAPWTMDPAHTSIGFAVKHLAVSTVRGELKTFEGTLEGEPAKPATLKAAMTIQAASVDTRVDKRDEHLRSADFLDVAKFPTIVFKAEKTELRGGKPVMIGVLTLHGVSRRIEIPFTVGGPVVDPWGAERVGLEGAFVIHRQDYGIESYPGMVGDDLTIVVSAEYTRPR